MGRGRHMRVSRLTGAVGVACAFSVIAPLISNAAIASSAAASSMAIASSAASTVPISLRLPQPATDSKHLRFEGFVRLAAPRAWHGKRSHSDNGEATFHLTLANNCTAWAFVATDTSVTSKGARAQLLAALPAGSQPSVPVPRPVSIIGQGAIGHGSGGWVLGAPRVVEPLAGSPAGTGPSAFTFYGGSLLKIKPSLWAGISVGFVTSAKCPAVLPERAAVIGDLTRMLRGTALINARVKPISG